MPKCDSIKLQSNFIIEIKFWHGCSPVNLLYIFRTPFAKNTSGGLLLDIHVKSRSCMFSVSLVPLSKSYIYWVHLSTNTIMNDVAIFNSITKYTNETTYILLSMLPLVPSIVSQILLIP